MSEQEQHEAAERLIKKALIAQKLKVYSKTQFLKEMIITQTVTCTLFESLPLNNPFWEDEAKNVKNAVKNN